MINCVLKEKCQENKHQVGKRTYDLIWLMRLVENTGKVNICKTNEMITLRCNMKETCMNVGDE